MVFAVQISLRVFCYSIGGCMFCPNCGVQSEGSQKFCKSCGTNMHLVSQAMSGKGDLLEFGQLSIDFEAVKKSAVDFGRNLKGAVSNSGTATRTRDTSPHDTTTTEKSRIKLHRKEKKEVQLPKPKEWLSYSWQHNLRQGLMTLFSGAGLGVALFYIGRIMIETGTIASIQDAIPRDIRGLEQFVRLVWLFALIPVLKGIGQIGYAAFFAESIETLSARFMPPVFAQHLAASQPGPVPSAIEPRVEDTEPVSGPAAPMESAVPMEPSSVTEHTTQFFEETARKPDLKVSEPS